tara:strand:- start:1100 stop:1297 length:198 start_codon:yes stop_codon:yes gene_type:complete
MIINKYDDLTTLEYALKIVIKDLEQSIFNRGIDDSITEHYKDTVKSSKRILNRVLKQLDKVESRV